MKLWITAIWRCRTVWLIALAPPLAATAILVGIALWTELFVSGVVWADTLINIGKQALFWLQIGLGIGATMFIIFVPVTRYFLANADKAEEQF